MELELSIEQAMQLEYDLLLERNERMELAEYPPHTDNALQCRDDSGERVPGCYITQAVDVHQ